MKFDAKTITLKDGRSAVLRLPTAADAEDMLNYLIETAGETEFLLAYPEERQGMTVEQEAAFIQRMTQGDNSLFLVCEVEGRVAGCCQVDFQTRMKTRHGGHRAAEGVLGAGHRHGHVPGADRRLPPPRADDIGIGVHRGQHPRPGAV